jgi:ADP-heptose:LPS heptosyltransferase
MGFEELAALFSIPGISFFNLQIEENERFPADCQKQRFIDLTSQITDFAETAALMEQLDLIISVDTATAHLAGALCRPAWTLLPFVPDWRWGLEREDTPWYPTMRLFRQKTAGDWGEVIQRVALELRVRSSQPRASALPTAL